MLTTYINSSVYPEEAKTMDWEYAKINSVVPNTRNNILSFFITSFTSNIPIFYHFTIKIDTTNNVTLLHFLFHAVRDDTDIYVIFYFITLIHYF